MVLRSCGDIRITRIICARMSKRRRMHDRDVPMSSSSASSSSSLSHSLPPSAALPEPVALSLMALPVSIVAMCASFLPQTCVVVARTSRWFRRVLMLPSSACPRFSFCPVDATLATRAADYYMNHRHCIRHLFAHMHLISEGFEHHYLRTLAHMLWAPSAAPAPLVVDSLAAVDPFEAKQVPTINSCIAAAAPHSVTPSTAPPTPIYSRDRAASSEAGGTLCEAVGEEAVGEEAFRIVHIRLPLAYHMISAIQLPLPVVRALFRVVACATRMSCDHLNGEGCVGQALREAGSARVVRLDITGTLSKVSDVQLMCDHCPMLTHLKCGMVAEVIPAAYGLAPRLRVLDIAAYFVSNTETACAFAEKLVVCTSIRASVNVSLALLLSPVVERFEIDFTDPDRDPEEGDEEEGDEKEDDEKDGEKDEEEEDNEEDDEQDDEKDEYHGAPPAPAPVAETRAPTSSSPLPVSTSTPGTLPALADKVIVSSALHTLCFSNAYLDAFFFDYWTQHLGALPASLTVIEFDNCTVCSTNFCTKLAVWTSVRSLVFVDTPCSPRVRTRLRAACPWITVSSR